MSLFEKLKSKATSVAAKAVELATTEQVVAIKDATINDGLSHYLSKNQTLKPDAVKGVQYTSAEGKFILSADIMENGVSGKLTVELGEPTIIWQADCHRLEFPVQEHSMAFEKGFKNLIAGFVCSVFKGVFGRDLIYEKIKMVLEQDKVVVDIDAALDGSKWHHATKVSKVTKIAPRDGAVDVGFVVLGQGA